MAQSQRGKASFYSKRASGARTANGERVHHDSLTCAHRTYPFGTLLRVTNLSNGREVIVKVNDRGPFGRGRIIDLSWSAAKELDMIAQGVTTVQVAPVSGSPGVPFRVDSLLDLPEMDFEVAEAGYSIIDAWKAAPDAEGITPSNVSSPPPTPNKAAASAEAGRSRHPTAATRKQQAKQAKKGNKWSDVFEKIKNWGKDRF
ncbi:MAG: septal ring lytic transglycosylase RlpA family protein [Prevotella sp.]|nr:septal ring lytic transglycosylase RlpA family protein [Prevotella sp.]